MSRIVVTGAAGNCGRRICEHLVQQGYDVVGVDLAPADPGRPPVLQADLSDFGQTNAALEGADGVVHFGAVPSDGIWTPAETFRNNVVSTFNVLESCRLLGVRRAAVASSIQVHGPDPAFQYVPIDEEHPAVPTGAYGVGKLLGERLCELYHQRCGMSIASFRLPRLLYSDTYAQRLPLLWERPELSARILFTYVDGQDVAEACRLVMEHDLGGHEVFWLAADDIEQPGETMAMIQRHRPDVRDFRAPLPGRTSPISHAKITRMLGWRPRVKWSDHYNPPG